MLKNARNVAQKSSKNHTSIVISVLWLPAPRASVTQFYVLDTK